ncbi:MAG: hypothetical protein J6P55_01825 [Bacteroidaceae bacterium]|nr:hypothetical protein [Bacteroidaceae bacterium]
MEQIAKISWGERLNHVLANHKDLLYIIGILVVTVISFWPTFFNGLQSGWDDQWQVTNGYTTNGFTINNIRGILFKTYGGQYSPVNQIMYTFLYKYIRYQPFYYHTVCLLLHLINVAMVYMILVRLYKWEMLSLENKKCVIFASFCALCFAINPLQVESVAWVSASKIVLFAMFYLVGTWCYLSYIENRSLKGLVIAFFCFILSLGSKEQSVVFPFWLLLLHWAHGDFVQRRNSIIGVAPFLLLAAIFGIMYLLYASELDGNLTSITRGNSLWERLEIAGFAISVYIRRWFLPLDMQHIYEMPETIPAWFLLCPICVTIIVITYWKKIKPVTLFWFLFFLIHIGLSVHLIPMGRFVIMADRYMYLPCIAVANILLILIGGYGKRRAVRACLACLLLFWCFVSFLRTQDWENTEKIRANNSIIVKFLN